MLCIESIVDMRENPCAVPPKYVAKKQFSVKPGIGYALFR
jgi:hypothetical protein